MKTSYILFVAVLLLGTSAMALTAKVESPVFIKGTSVGSYAKPGAAVDIRYSSEQVNVGEVSKVDIFLTTSIELGTMKVVLKVDKGLDRHSDLATDFSFELDKDKKEYPLHLEVSSDEDGLYYVRVLVSIKGQGMRAFAVPVHVGK